MHTQKLNTCNIIITCDFTIDYTGSLYKQEAHSTHGSVLGHQKTANVSIG